MNVGDLVQKKARDRGYENPAQLHAALVVAEGEETAPSYVSVHQWWNGHARPERFAPVVSAFLGFTDAERLQLHELPLVPRSGRHAASESDAA